MKWRDQLVHVARKDLRQQRWLVLAFAAYLGLGVVLGLAGRLTSPVYNFVAMGLIFFATLLVATFVQADPPAEEQAHWATLPLERSAVLAAKGVVALLVVILLPMLGQAILIAPFGFDVPGIGRMLARSAAWIAFVTAVCLGIASFFRTLAGYFLAILAALVLWVAYGMVFAGAGGAGSTLGAWAIGIAAIGLSSYLYVTRNVRRARWAAGGAVALVGLVSVAGSLASAGSEVPAISEAWDGTVPTELQPRIQLHDIERMSPLDRGQMVRYSVSVRGLAADYVYHFAPVSGAVVDGGTMEPVGFRGSGSRLSGAPVLPEAEGYTWLSGSWPHETWLEGEQLAPLDEPDGSAAGGVLEVDIYVARRSFAALLPLDRGASAHTRGLTLQIDSLVLGGATPRLAVSARSWNDPGQLGAGLRPGFSDRPLVFALLNRAAREAVLLEPTATGGAACCFLLPGGAGFDRTILLGSPPPSLTSPRARIDERWLANAELLLAVHEPVGRFRERVELSRDLEVGRDGDPADVP